MPARIHLLSENIIHKIAAGEVIERPASVVKELVENAIDAQARRIHIDISAGGKQAIVVADDGTGMEREDCLLCVRRHATSKMSSPGDLFAISTLGFRGEALASIGAIARLTIETRTREEAEGTRLVIEGGIQREVMPMGRAPGTTIAVRNMFFNTPARRKFLRHTDTEARHITQTVVQLAAGYPEVGFHLEHQGRTLLEYPPSSRRERAAEMLGIDEAVLLEARLEEEGYAVEAFLSPPEHCRRSRSKQYLLVRGRPVVCRPLGEALYEGYGGLLPEEHHPSYVVWLDLDPRRVDVNVHPTKREIRLADERQAAGVVKGAVRRALDMPELSSFSYERPVDLDFPPRVGEGRPLSLTGESTGEKGEGTPSSTPPQEKGKPLSEQMSLSLLSPSSTARFSTLGREAAEGPSPVLSEIKTATLLTQLHRKYLVAPVKDGMVLIDQQAAHERVLYEEALKRFSGQGAASQQLLFPLTVNLSAVELDVVREAGGLFTELGFSLREFGPGTLLIEAIPAEMETWGEGEVFYQILNDILEERKAVPGLKEALARAYANRSALRAGHLLNSAQMQGLLDRLLEADEPFVCPHGRPTMVKIALKDLDRLFGRA